MQSPAPAMALHAGLGFGGPCRVTDRLGCMHAGQAVCIPYLEMFYLHFYAAPTWATSHPPVFVGNPPTTTHPRPRKASNTPPPPPPPPTHPRTPHHTHVTCPSPPNVHACVCRLALQLSDTAGGTSVMYACKHGLVALAERLMRVGGGVCWGVYWGGGGACWGVCWGCTRTLPRRVGPHMHALHTHAANVDCFVWCVMSAA